MRYLHLSLQSSDLVKPPWEEWLIAGTECRWNTPYPKLVCCPVQEVELPLLVLFSFSSSHCILEKRFIFFIALERIGKPLHIKGSSLEQLRSVLFALPALLSMNSPGAAGRL